MDNIKVSPVGSLGPSGCPKPVTIPNGGFDTGEIALWKTPQPLDFQKPGTSKIISPGYNSQHALEMDFEQGADGYYVSQNTDGLCIGELYMANFAVNWVNYTYSKTGPNVGCNLSVLPGGCQGKPNAGYFYPTTTGWHQYSHPCQASGKGGIFDVNVECVGTDVPAFALRLDGFSLSSVGSASPSGTSPPTGSPTPTGSPPPSGTTSPSSTSTPSSERRRKAKPRWV
jgi:hypothetical protein